MFQFQSAKFYLASFVCFLFATQVQAQSWSKQQQQTLFDGCKERIKTKAPKASESQREEHCLCELEKITSSYNAADYLNLIEVKRSKIERENEQGCAQSVGIQLQDKASTGASSWTKEQQTKIFESCKSENGKIYPFLSKAQLEDLCLCKVEKITTDYSTPEAFDALLDVKAKQVHKNSFEACASSKNIALSAPTPPKSECPEIGLSACSNLIETLDGSFEPVQLVASYANKYCFSNLQIYGVLEAISFSSDRVKAAKLLYPKSTDKAAFSTNSSLFSASDWKDIQKFMSLNP